MGMYDYLQYSPIAHAVGMTLLHFIWQGLAVALVLGGILAFLKRGRPQVRYLISCLALLLMFLLPLSTFGYLCATSDFKGPTVIPSRLYALLEEAQARAEAEEAARTAELVRGLLSEGVDEAAAVTLAEAMAETSESRGARTTGEAAVAEDKADRFFFVIPWEQIQAFCYALSPWFSVFWGFGVAVLTARLLGALHLSRRLRRRDSTVLNGPLQETVDRLRARLEITWAVALLKSRRVTVPTVVGWLCPAILLPASALTGLTPGQLEALLAHELAHIRRHDYLVNLLQNVVETLLFYHPAVWWVSKRIRDDRELCCDDMVVEICGDARIYATALAEMLALRMGKSAVALAASGGSLPNRLRRMLGSTSPAAGRMSRGEAGAIVVALLLTVSALFALRAAAAEEIDPEAQQRFVEAVALERAVWGLSGIERTEPLREAIEILDTLIQEYPEVDEFRGQLGVTLYDLLWNPVLSSEEKREVTSYGIEVLEPVAEDYQTKSIAREYRLNLSLFYKRSGNMLDAVKTARELVEVEPDNPVYHHWLGTGCLLALGQSLIEAGEPYAETIREAWDHHLQGELLGARYDSLYYEFQSFRWEIRDGKHFADQVANHLRGLGRTEEAIETYEMALSSFANVVEKDPQFYGDLIMIRRQYEGFLKSIGRTAEAEQVAAETDALRERLSAQNPDFFRAYRDKTWERFRPTRGARVDYTVHIATPGEYQLYLRLEAHDPKSCRVLAYVDELADGLGGNIADGYIISCYSDTDHDFATEPWNSTGVFEDAGGQVPVVWSIPAAGDYTLRICGIQNGDGVALDALVFQRADLPAPEGDGPGESQQAAAGVFLESGGQITMEAEHFAARKSFVIEEMGGEWRVVPGEDAGDVAHANARGGVYLQALPDKTPSSETMEAYTRYIELDPGNAWAWYQRGLAYKGQKRYAEALDDAAKAIQLDPENGWFWWLHGWVNLHLKRYAEALDDFVQAIQLDPENPEFWYKRGLAYGSLERYPEALDDLAKAIELNYVGFWPWFRRGQVYSWMGKWEEAVAELSQGIALDANYANEVVSRGRADFHYLHAALWACRGEAYMNLKQFAKAIEDYDKAIELEPENAAHWQNRGAAYIRLKQFAKAIEDCDKAIELEPENAAHWNNRGVAYQNPERYGEALDDFGKACELDPTNGQFFRNRANVLAELEQYDEAIQDFAKAVELAPDNPDVWYFTSLAQLAAGDFQAYRTTCTEALKRFSHTNDKDQANNCAWTSVLVPDADMDWSLPLRLARLAVDAPGSGPSEAGTLGAVLCRAGRSREAFEILENLAVQEVSACDVYFLAMACYQLGQPDAARKWFDQAAVMASEQMTKGATWNRRFQWELSRKEVEALLNGVEVARTAN